MRMPVLCVSLVSLSNVTHAHLCDNCFRPQSHAKMVMSDLLEGEYIQAGWKCVLIEDGGLCVMMGGPYLMLKWCANNLASLVLQLVCLKICKMKHNKKIPSVVIHLQVSHTTCRHTLVKELAQFY